MANKILLCCFVLSWVMVAQTMWAHTGQPVSLHIQERDDHLLQVSWRVPNVLPVTAQPTPVLPPQCTALGEASRIEQSDTWLNQQQFRCQRSIAGEEIGVRYPLYNPSLMTLIRIDLETQEQHVHVLGPDERVWRMPAGSPDWLNRAQDFVFRGVAHIFSHWIHLAFALVLGLLSPAVWLVWCLTAFTVGQLLSVGIVGAFSIEPAVDYRTYAEVMLALAVVYVARELLRPRSGAVRLVLIAAAAGLTHGFGTAASMLPAQETILHNGVTWLFALLGMDATLLVLTGSVALVRQHFWPSPMHPWGRNILVYALGSASVALVLFLILMNPRDSATAASNAGRLEAILPVVDTRANGTAVYPQSQRLTTGVTDDAVQSFLTLAPFEVRHEVLIRLHEVAAAFNIDATEDGLLDTNVQEPLKQKLAAFTLAHTVLHVDGKPASPVLERVDFMTVGSKGVDLQVTPQREPLQRLYIGVVISYLTTAMPDQVTLIWTPFPHLISRIPATVIDPEASRSGVFTRDHPSLRWDNRLSRDPVPTIAAVAIEPSRVSVPLLSILVLATALALVITGRRRGWRPTIAMCGVRVLLVSALAVAPWATATVALPQQVSSTPTQAHTRRILAPLLTAVYRAFEFREESAVYDRLAVSVADDMLARVYLEHRHALNQVERGGARGRVEAVDFMPVDAVEADEQGGFRAKLAWTVSGSVVHFGHRHYRKNRYHAWITVAPIDDTWKIRRIDILDEHRLL